MAIYIRSALPSLLSSAILALAFALTADAFVNVPPANKIDTVKFPDRTSVKTQLTTCRTSTCTTPSCTCSVNTTPSSSSVEAPRALTFSARDILQEIDAPSESRPSSALFSTREQQQTNNNVTTMSQKGFLSIVKQRLQQVSNVASFLCVLDCTILPIITVLLPLVGLAGSPVQMEWIHTAGHNMALFFVLPVGSVTATMNYSSHKRPLIALPSILGLFLVYLANAGHSAPILSMLPHDLVHALHCGNSLHQVTNIVGCALLLTLNQLSRKIGCSAGPQCCEVKDCAVEQPHRKRYSRL